MTSVTGMNHVPVLPQETLTALAVKPGHYLDATVGAGGHSRLLLEAEAALQVMAIDQDADAIASAQAILAPFKQRVQFWRGNFAEFDPGPQRFDGILADLGVSSTHFDQPQRGFSFRHPAPLDMRMNQSQQLTAAEIVNHWNEVDLANLIYTLGEERLSRRIARQIVAQRPFQTTTDLADAIARCVPASYRHGRIHPATRTFQALRIAVNRELEVLDTLLQEAPHWLKPRGRLVIISFHSLEDRRVKHAFRASPLLTVISKKPIMAQPQEVAANPRSRSAKLRVAERLT